MDSVKGRTLAVDTETNGEDIRDGRGYCMGVSVAGLDTTGELVGYYFPFRHVTGGNLDERVLHKLQETVATAPSVFFHNAKFDLVSLRTLNIEVGTFYDTMLMCHLINENRPFSKSLNSCADYYLEGGIRAELRAIGKAVAAARRKDDIEQIKNLERKRIELESQAGTFHKDIGDEFKKYIQMFGWGSIPASMMFPYAKQDAILTYQLAEKVFPLFKEEGLLDYWHDQKAKSVRVLSYMEGNGVRIDRDICVEQAEKGEARMSEIVKELGRTPSGTNNLTYLLIEQLGLPVLKETPSGKPCFDKNVMPLYEELLEDRDDPTARLILEYRGWQKTVSSNYRAYLELLSPDGRLRPNFKLHGTVTGRLACEKPNLQQIPKSSAKEWNGHLKAAFIPKDGYILVEADYSQLELRLATAYAREHSLMQTFNEGRDIFTEMAAGLGLSRSDCKTYVYATQYGAGIKKIASSLKLPVAKAQEIRQRYYDTYPGFKALSDRATAGARSIGKSRLWTGRYRHFFDPKEEARKAMNSLMQGGGADVVERQMARLYEAVAAPSNGEVRMVLTVHDSVVFEIKKGTEHKYLNRIRDIMEDVDTITAFTGESFGVKFAVDIHKWATEISWNGDEWVEES